MVAPKEVAQRIESICKVRGVEIKSMLKNAGLDPNTIQNMANDEMPAADKLAAIAVELRISLDYMLGLDKYKNQGFDEASEIRILELFHSLPDDVYRGMAIGYAKGLGDACSCSPQ